MATESTDPIKPVPIKFEIPVVKPGRPQPSAIDQTTPYGERATGSVRDRIQESKPTPPAKPPSSPPKKG